MSGGAQQLLVVEDSELIALDLSETLSDAGYEILGPAATLTDALRLLSDHKPAAALVDVHLGSENAFPLAEQLLARGIPYIFLTGADTTTEIPEALRRAPQIGKPYKPEAILGSIRGLLGR